MAKRKLRVGDLILLDEDMRWRLGAPSHYVALVVHARPRSRGVQTTLLVDNRLVRRFLLTWRILCGRR